MDRWLRYPHPSLSLNVPEVPAFNREPFQHEIKTLVENIVYDDLCNHPRLEIVHGRLIRNIQIS